MDNALLTKNNLTGLPIAEENMKKIFASLTLAAFMLSGATAFANTKNQATNSAAKMTTTSGKKKGKRKHKRHHAATSATPSAAPKKK